MKKKQYKVKYENGEIKPLEPIDLDKAEEGLVTFFVYEELDDGNEENWLKFASKNNALNDLFEPSEDIYTLNDGRPFNG